MALHTFDIVNTIFIGLRDRSAAGIALIKTALDQAVTYGDAVVEDEAFTLPSALFLRHLFEILQDSALEVIDFINPFTEQKVGRFFTTNAASAKHGNLFVVKPMFIFSPPLGKLSESFGFGINRPLKRADADLIVIARINHRNIRCRNQRVPFERINIVTSARARIDIGLAHCDDFFFQADFHALERHDAGGALFMFKIRATGQCGDMGPKTGNPLFRACDCAVDTLFGQQNCAFDALMFAK